MYFKEKTALVTGAARGIGKSIARKLFENGSTVILVDLLDNELREACGDISGDSMERIEGLPCDISDPESVASLFKQVKQKYGCLDILVNNAGITRDNIFLRMSIDQWQKVIDVNLTGTFLCCRYGAALLRKSSQGRIINISSVAARGNPGQANYSASKAGVIGLTKTLALELARYKITVNAVAPGFVETEMTQSIPEKAREQWMNKIPAGRPGCVDDIADAVIFLASDTAAYITGVILGVDGGLGI